MKQILEQRLQSLKEEFEAGQKLLAEYEAKQRNLRETLLRISGAIQILEEVIAEGDSEANDEVSQPDDRPAEMEPLGELAASGEGT
jgi:spore coat protein CotH